MLEEFKKEPQMQNKNVGAGVALLAAGIALMVSTSTATGIALMAVGIVLLATGSLKSKKD